MATQTKDSTENTRIKMNGKYAWNFVIPTEQGDDFEGVGESVENYNCFFTPVVAPLDGKIVRVVMFPIDYNSDLVWRDTLPVSKTMNIFMRYLSILFDIYNSYPDDYIVNLRLGWLCYITKDYKVSEKYYNKQYSIEN